MDVSLGNSGSTLGVSFGLTGSVFGVSASFCGSTFGLTGSDFFTGTGIGAGADGAGAAGAGSALAAVLGFLAGFGLIVGAMLGLGGSGSASSRLIISICKGGVFFNGSISSIFMVAKPVPATPCNANVIATAIAVFLLLKKLLLEISPVVIKQYLVNFFANKINK